MLSRSMALRVVIILQITATMMTLDFLLAAARRLETDLRAGLYRLALRAAMREHYARACDPHTYSGVP